MRSSRSALRVCGVLALTVLASLAPVQRADGQPTTSLFLTSDPGDPAGGGKTFSYTTADGTFTADSWGRIEFWNPQVFWDLHFAPPAGQTLTPGIYDHATEWPSQSPTAPGLSVHGSGSSFCGRPTGRFVVLEATYGPSNEVVSFAVDFEQHCNGIAPALWGSVRYASAVPVTPRLSVAPAVTYEGDGEAKSLNFVISLSAKAAVPVSVDYATANGTAVAGTDYAAALGTAVFSPGQVAVEVSVPVLGNTMAQADRVMTLDLSNPAGAPIAFGQGTGSILDDDTERTFLRFASDPGDPVGGGRTFTLTPLDGNITASHETYGTQFHYVGTERWDVGFVPAAGGTIVPGLYENVTGTYPYGAPGPRLDIWGLMMCSYATGRFVVHEAEYGPGTEVIRFAADYEYHCEGKPPALRGSVRYRSLVDTNPRVSVGSTSVYEGDGEAVALPFWISLSTAAAGTVSVPYATADGTGVAGVDYVAVSGVAEFPAGSTSVRVDVPLLGNRVVQPNRTVRLVLGTPVGTPVEYGETAGTIVDDDAGRTIAHYERQLDPIGSGGGTTATWTPVDGTFQVSGNATQTGASFRGAHYLGFSIAPASGGSLMPGFFANAAGYPSQDPARPGLSVSVDNISCGASSGRFVVHQAEYANGQVVRFAVDFIQQCYSGILYGSFRYNSTIPVTTLAASRMGFYPLPPCRLVDTRTSADAMGGSTTRAIAGVGACGVPLTAKSLVANVTVTEASAPGELRISTPGDVPVASAISFTAGRTRANNAVIPLSVGEFQVRNQSPADSWLHLIVDVSGYFQ